VASMLFLYKKEDVPHVVLVNQKRLGITIGLKTDKKFERDI
jgi:hypothetical protein